MVIDDHHLMAIDLDIEDVIRESPEAIELKEEVETHSGQRVRDDANVDASSMCDVELDA